MQLQNDYFASYIFIIFAFKSFLRDSFNASHKTSNQFDELVCISDSRNISSTFDFKSVRWRS